MIFTFGILPVGAHAQQGILLCIEADGHFSIEIADGIKCASDAELAGVFEQVTLDDLNHYSTDESHCVDCIDLVFESGADADCNAVVILKSSNSAPSLAVAPVVSPQKAGRVRIKNTPHKKPVYDRGILSLLSTVIILT